MCRCSLWYSSWIKHIQLSLDAFLDLLPLFLLKHEFELYFSSFRCSVLTLLNASHFSTTPKINQMSSSILQRRRKRKKSPVRKISSKTCFNVKIFWTDFHMNFWLFKVKPATNSFRLFQLLAIFFEFLWYYKLHGINIENRHRTTNWTNGKSTALNAADRRVARCLFKLVEHWVSPIASIFLGSYFNRNE